MYPGHPIAAAQLARLHMNEDLAREAALRAGRPARNAAPRAPRVPSSSRMRFPAFRRAWSVRFGH